MGSKINILKSKAENDYQFPTYADATADTSFYQIGDIVVVEQTTGGVFGFGSKQAGSYRWTGTTLEYFSQSLKDEIKENEDNLSQEILDRQSADSSLQTQITSNDSDILDLQLKQIDNRIIIKQASDWGVIDSSKIYVIDGKIDMGSTQIEVPPGGIFIRGLDYFVSCLFSSQDNYSMFVNQLGQPAGNVRLFNVEMYVDGLNSKILDLDNQGNFGAVEFISCNFGSFSTETTSVGSLTNYRQFRTDDLAFIRTADGIEFNGTWAGGFAVTSTILLSIPANATIFKEGTSLSFLGSSISDLNAISVDDTVTVFDFQDSNFSRDEGFQLERARFKIGTNPIPNMSVSTTKKLFKNCSAIKNTFPGGRWELTAQQITPLDPGVPAKALGTTTYDDLVHFSQTVDNALVYDSEIEKDFVITGQIVVDGGPNDEIAVILRKWNNLLGAYEDIKPFTRNISNVLGGLDIAYFDPYSPVTLNQNDRIEVWLRNNSDGTDATILTGSFIAVNVRN